MELTLLRSFVCAARELHFGRAAEILQLAQPSLSQQVARLERELRTPLFYRRGRRVTLTEAGRALLPLAERILALEADAIRTVQEVAGLERGRLSLCALPTLDQHLLPPWLAHFRREHPGIELRVRELRPSLAVARAVLAGEADLGFIQFPCELNGLASQVLRVEELSLIVPEGHSLARGGPAPLSAAAREPFVWVHEAQDPVHPLYAACLQAGFQPNIVCESGSPQGVLALVAAGLGLALLPRLAIEPRRGLVVVPLTPAPTRTLAVVWQPECLSPAARTFLNQCRD